MKATFKAAYPYQTDKMNLPVGDLEKAIPFYEKTFGFRVLSKQTAPLKSAILARDAIQIGLAENGGDPAQDGCFFEVDNLQNAFDELASNGLKPGNADFKMQQHGETIYKVFFVVAPDGLCYCLGERQN